MICKCDYFILLKFIVAAFEPFLSDSEFVTRDKMRSESETKYEVYPISLNSLSFPLALDIQVNNKSVVPASPIMFLFQAQKMLKFRLQLSYKYNKVPRVKFLRYREFMQTPNF